MAVRRKVDPTLASAHAYWRLAAKAYRADDMRGHARYIDIAERKFREYKRQQEFLKTLKRRDGSTR